MCRNLTDLGDRMGAQLRYRWSCAGVGPDVGDHVKKPHLVYGSACMGIQLV
jgi:hypothetical protein